MKVKVLKECRYKGTPISVGSEIEVEDNVAKIWLQGKYAKAATESQAQKDQAKPQAQGEDQTSVKPKTTSRKKK